MDKAGGEGVTRHHSDAYRRLSGEGTDDSASIRFLDGAERRSKTCERLWDKGLKADRDPPSWSPRWQTTPSAFAL